MDLIQDVINDNKEREKVHASKPGLSEQAEDEDEDETEQKPKGDDENTVSKSVYDDNSGISYRMPFHSVQ